MPFTIGFIDMFTMFVQQNGQWVEFLPLAREFGYVSQEEADCIRNYSLEEVAKVITYFGNEVQVLPSCCHWKVVGPAGHLLPSFVHSAYEVAA